MSSVEAKTPALDDRVASAQSPRALAARARRPVVQSGQAQLLLLGSLRRTPQRRQRWATRAEVLDGGARKRQESEISWVPVALRIATRAGKPLATHSSYKLKNSSLGGRAACGGWLVALTPSRTTLAQDGAVLESEGL